jgi:hypothetical protein
VISLTVVWDGTPRYALPGLKPGSLLCDRAERRDSRFDQEATSDARSHEPKRAGRRRGPQPRRYRRLAGPWA